jgi:hypothetical protein
MLGGVRAVGEEGGEGKRTEDDWVGGEDSEVWMQFLHSIRGVLEVDVIKGAYV